MRGSSLAGHKECRELDARFVSGRIGLSALAFEQVS